MSDATSPTASKLGPVRPPRPPFRSGCFLDKPSPVLEFRPAAIAGEMRKAREERRPLPPTAAPAGSSRVPIVVTKPDGTKRLSSGRSMPPPPRARWATLWRGGLVAALLVVLALVVALVMTHVGGRFHLDRARVGASSVARAEQARPSRGPPLM
jgi:hypothetical protein